MGHSQAAEKGAARTLQKLLDYVSLTVWLLTQPNVCRLWLQAAAGRWVFDFQHRRPCFAALDHIWKEIVHFHGWHPISTTSADELLSCICLESLIYTNMRAPLCSRVFALMRQNLVREGAIQLD